MQQNHTGRQKPEQSAFWGYSLSFFRGCFVAINMLFKNSYLNRWKLGGCFVATILNTKLKTGIIILANACVPTKHNLSCE
jgi:hypothetical protein